MPKLYSLFILLLIQMQLIAQSDIRDFVEKNTHKISTNNPEITDYTDLDVIGNAVGDARIVMLGEQDHGDAPAFLAKTRLIRYLHEKKGFNVIAFESDFFAGNEGLKSMPGTKQETAALLRQCVFEGITFCDACQPLLFDLVPAASGTSTPYQITGFDNQMFLKYSGANLSSRLDSFIRKEFPGIATNEKYARFLLYADTLAHPPYVQRTIQFYETAQANITPIQAQVEKFAGVNSFWNKVLVNLLAYAEEMKLLQTDIQRGLNIRDRQMAENLHWLASVKYPNQKIIVWAQNWHISKYSAHYDTKQTNRQSSMGTEFLKISPDKTYILGFTSFDGKAGRIGNPLFEVEKPGKKSFESWISDSLDYAFVDFKEYNLQHPDKPESFAMKGSITGLHKNSVAMWTKVFDGVFFVRHMYPCVLKK